MRLFVNEGLDAPNVFRYKVDAAVICELKQLLGGPFDPQDYCIVNPKWDSDIKWISPNSLESYRVFYSIFRRLGIAGHTAQFFDIDKTVRMYTGFLVSRSKCEKPNFHVDWQKTNNEAFTLITPITDNTAGFGLIYKRISGSIAEYEYKMGEAIIFGDDFLHSTKPGYSEQPVVLLSFTFGTDKMEHWPRISLTAGGQSNLVRLPDGNFMVKDIDH